MGLGTSIFLIAVGAILDFAVDVQTQGFNLHTIGVILMVVGAIGAVLSLVFWSSWGGFHSSRRTVVESGSGSRVYQDELL
jgi:sulfite exporter TauE/SafE